MNSLDTKCKLASFTDGRKDDSSERKAMTLQVYIEQGTTTLKRMYYFSIDIQKQLSNAYIVQQEYLETSYHCRYINDELKEVLTFKI